MIVQYSTRVNLTIELCQVTVLHYVLIKQLLLILLKVVL